MKKPAFYTLAPLGLLLAACASVGPDYEKPQSADLPAEFSEERTSRDALPPVCDSERWWTVYEDEGLNAAMEAAHENNPSLQAALARLAEARAKLGASEAAQSISADGEATALLRETSRQTIPIPSNPVSYRVSGDTYRAAVGASYELDLWGRVKRSIESANAQLAASEADLRAVRLAMEADIANLWLGLRETNAETLILKETTELRKEEAALLRERAESGLASELDLHRTLAEIATLEAELATLDKQAARQNNALATLCGQAATGFTAKASASGDIPLPPRIPAGLPVDMLARRPDIAQAEAVLHARSAEIGVAEAAKYPRVALTGSAGFENANLGDIFNRDSQFWQIGPSLSVPLLTGGRTQAEIDAAKARMEQALATHRQATLQAVREVEDALADLRSMHERDAALERACESARLAHSLANERYRSGYATYLDILDARRSLLSLQRQKVQNRGAMQSAGVALIKALGGGWQGAE